MRSSSPESSRWCGTTPVDFSTALPRRSLSIDDLPSLSLIPNKLFRGGDKNGLAFKGVFAPRRASGGVCLRRAALAAGLFGALLAATSSWADRGSDDERCTTGQALRLVNGKIHTMDD